MKPWVVLIIPLLWPAFAAAEADLVCRTELGWCTLAEAAQEPSQCSCVAEGRAVAGRVERDVEPNPLAALGMGEITRSLLPPATFASRGFAGPSQLPPTDFRAYGVVVFKARATRFDRDRHMMFCEAYLSALPPRADLAVDPEHQMITIWPLSRDRVADELNAAEGEQASLCEAAIDDYGLVHAQNALALLSRYQDGGTEHDLSGPGPFLVAWTPGSEIGRPGSVALLVNLSLVDRPDEALNAFTRWRERIQDNPELWREPLDRESLVDAIRRFFDRQGVILDGLARL